MAKTGDDGIEARVMFYALDCWACRRAARHGAPHLVGQALVRDGSCHYVGVDKKALCDDYGGWNAVIEVT